MRTSRPSAGETVHPVYIRFVCTLLRQNGKDPEAVLAAVGLDSHRVTASSDWLEFDTFERFLEAAGTALGCPSFGLDLGSRFQLVAYSAVGHAAVTSATLRDSLQVLSRFGALRLRNLSVRYLEETDGATVVMYLRCHSESARRILYEVLLALLVRLTESVTGSDADYLDVQMPFASPPWVGRYAMFRFARLGFGGEQLVVRYPRAALDTACLSADAKLCERATRECEEQLHLAETTPLSTRVRELVSRSLEDTRVAACPEITDIADHLHVSARTLMRRLKREGSSYQAIVDEIRAEQAIWLLKYSSMPIAELAARLGFEDTSSFNRAFRRWLGVAPTSLRSGRRSG